MDKLRPYAAMTMLFVLLFMAATGVLLYLAPQGPGSRLWEFWGLSKHHLKNIHFCLALVMVGSALLHGTLNITSLTNYLKHETNFWQHPLFFAVFIVTTVFVVALQL